MDGSKIAAGLRSIIEIAKHDCLFCSLFQNSQNIQLHKPNQCPFRSGRCLKCGDLYHGVRECSNLQPKINDGICKMCCLPKNAHGYSFHDEDEWAKQCKGGQIPEFLYLAWRLQLVEELKSFTTFTLLHNFLWNTRDYYQLGNGARVIVTLFDRKPLFPNYSTTTPLSDRGINSEKRSEDI